MSKPPAYQHYAQDWLVGTAHLTLEAQGAYQRLLDHQWVDGPIRNDVRVIRRMLGLTPAGFARVWRQIEEKFPLRGDGCRANERLESERLKQSEYREQQGESGRKGALKRWHGKPHRVAHPEPIESPKRNDSSSSSSSISTSKTDESTTMADSSFARDLVIAANTALRDNPTAQREHITRPLRVDLAAPAIREWEAAGITHEHILATVTEVCRRYKPTGNSRWIHSFGYFDRAVREGWAAKQSTPTPPPAPERKFREVA